MSATSVQKLPEPLIEANGYYSTEDAQRMQALVRALVQGRRPVALSCASDEALEHYSRLFVRDLRQQDGVKVIAHLAGSTDKLVQQVNDLLADQPLAQVVARDAKSLQPTRVFVVHDSPELSNEELALLVRLVNDLPGANLRLALIQDRDPAVTGNLQVLGPQALHWRVQVPGVPDGARQAASRAALREALQETPDTLPPWARPDDRKSSRRRWRLAFWRRADKPAREATKTTKGTAKARSATPTASRGTSAPVGSKAARTAKSKPAATPSPGARRNRVVLVSGILLSAVLASALGTWLSMQPSVQRAARPVPPSIAPAAPGPATAAISFLSQR